MLFLISTAATLLQSATDVLVLVVVARAQLKAFRGRSKQFSKSTCSPLLQNLEGNLTLSGLMTVDDGEVSANGDMQCSTESETNMVFGNHRAVEATEVDERAIRDALLDELEVLDREIEMRSLKGRREEG